ncbi:MAG: dienelactone hydrolase family protein [Thiobacillaceae bacterium]|jgi:dienelactone hydrolase|nr:dienelactone hydrolase family protein [Thiobacillaceae bacterium]
MRKLIFALFILALGLTSARAEVRGQEIAYSDGNLTMKGYLAWDAAIQGKRPGVLVVHEWWGHNAYARKRADMLAKLGYLALAVDMYGDGRTADHPKDAGAFAGAVGKDARPRFEAAMKVLQGHPLFAPGQLAALGYCFGGTQVLNMARQGLPLKGVASYHGSLATKDPAAPGKVQARVAVFTGAEDPMIPAEQVDGFRREMDQAGVSYFVVSYPGVKHSFTNPDADDYGPRFGLPLAYDRQADEDSWTRTATFLKEVFR